MITKEKYEEQQKKDVNLQAENEYINYDIEELNRKYNARWKFAIFSFLTLSVILTLIVIYIFKYRNMSIYNPYETKIIKVTSEVSKGWHANDNIDLFTTKDSKGQKVIFPGQSGEYDFVIDNTNNVPIYYKIEISEKNQNKINMKYRLKLNNVYVIGNEDTYEPIEKLNLNNIKILENAKSLYTLEWKWEKSENDAEILNEEDASYRIYIDIESKMTGRINE